MIDLERQLTRALSRQEAPPGFTERVLQAAATRHRRRRGWLAAASLVAILLPSAFLYHRHQRLQLAEAQLRLALEVASEQLNHVFQRLNAPPEKP